MRRSQLVFVAALVLLIGWPIAAPRLSPPPAEADAAPFSMPPGFVDEVVVGGLTAPTAMAWAPDGRLFIAHKSGLVKVFQNGALLAAPFVDISAEVNSYWDRGLLGIAVHPDFPSQPYIYLLYTYDPPETLANSGNAGPDGGGARVSRLLRVRADPAQSYSAALPAGQADARTVILGTNSSYANIGDPTRYDNPNASCKSGAGFVRDCLPSDGRSHSIGTVAFAPDGSLFVGSGDASDWSFSDTRSLNVQNLDAMNGKIFRIDPLSGRGYSDNPFYDGDPDSNRSKVYDYGLRNPFRFTFQPTTGELYIGDVGDGTWEEIDSGRGKNFGWPCYEGGYQSGQPASLRRTTFQSSSVCQGLYAQEGAAGGPSAALVTYPHSTNKPMPSSTDYTGASLSVYGQSITLGDFYIGSSYPITYQNGLFFSDFNNEWMKVAQVDGAGQPTLRHFGSDTFSAYNGVVQLRSGPDTNIYYIFFTSNINSNTNPGPSSQIRRLRYVGGGNRPPVAAAAATPSSGSYPLAVAFSSQGSYDPDAQALSYSWDFGDGTPTSNEASPGHIYTQPGSFTATLTLSDGAGGSDSISLPISAGNTAPVPQILSPAADASYAVGDTIALSGAATDAEEGGLAGDRLSWTVLLHHNQHVHGDFFSATGASASFVAPDHGDGTSITVCLTASDGQGLATSTCRDLAPRTVVYSFDSQPSGLELTYGGVSYTTPFTATTIIGSHLLLAAPLTQDQRSFGAWQHGGGSEQYITVGEAPRSFLATYVNRPPVALPAATPASVRWPATVAFSGTLSYDPEGAALSYSWDFGDGATGVGAQPQHAYARPGSYQARLSVTDALQATSSATITIDILNNAPTASISPLQRTSYAVGETIHFGGSGSDAEDGALSGDGLVWQVIRRTAGTSETLLNTTGAGGSFVVPDHNDDTAIEIRLTARDSNGGSATKSVQLTPQRSTMAFASTPPGAQLRIDGALRTAPYSMSVIVGSSHTLAAPSGWQGMRFSGWSSGAAAEHTLLAGATPTAVTAHYVNRVYLPQIQRPAGAATRAAGAALGGPPAALRPRNPFLCPAIS